MALKLTRRRGERLQIGDQIAITVIHIGSNQVRLEINAPTDVPIFRSEVLAKREKAELATVELGGEAGGA